MKLCIGPEWEETGRFLQDLLSRAALRHDDRGVKSEFLAHLQNAAWTIGLQNGATLTELRSDKRLGLIFDTNIGLRRSYRRFSSSNNDIANSACPAWELVKMGRGPKRRDWPSRWSECGGKIYNGRMLALKSDSIWHDISAFPFPFPPFDIDDDMNVIEVGRDEAVSLGLLGANAEIKVREANEPRVLYFFDVLPDGKYPTEIPEEEEEYDCADEDLSEEAPKDTKFMKVAEVGLALKRQKTVSPDEEARLLQRLTEAVTEGLDNYPDWLALAYRYTGEICDRAGRFDQAVEYYGYALRFDPKVGVKKRYDTLLKQASSS